MTLKRFETFVIVLIIGIIGVIYALTQKPVPQVAVSEPTQQSAQNLQEDQSNQTLLQQVPTSDIKYQGQEGKTALEILKASHRVETKNYSGLGEFVIAIDGLETDSKTNFWSFYVNGKQSPVGAGDYTTHDSDQIEWKIETIDQ